MRRHEPIFPQIPDFDGVIIQDSDTTSQKNLLVAGDDGAIIQAIGATSDDTADKWLQFWIKDTGSNYYMIGEALVPDGSGTNQTDAAVNVLDTAYFPFLPEDGTLPLKPGYTLVVAAQATLSSGKEIHVFAISGDYDDGS
jgi:hypothetical protein